MPNATLDTASTVDSPGPLSKIKKNALKTEEMKKNIITTLLDPNGPTDLCSLANHLNDQSKLVRHENTCLLLH